MLTCLGRKLNIGINSGVWYVIETCAAVLPSAPLTDETVTPTGLAEDTDEPDAQPETLAPTFGILRNCSRAYVQILVVSLTALEELDAYSTPTRAADCVAISE